MNACNHEDLLLLAAGEADAERADATERHVRSCRACADELARLREDLAALGRLPDLEPSGRAVERTIAAGRAAVSRRRQAAARPVLRRLWPAVAVAASVAVVLLANFLLRGPETATNPPATGPSVARIAETPRRVPAAVPAAGTSTLWEASHNLAVDTRELMDDFADQQAISQWTVAEAAVVRTAGQSNLDEELLRLEESLEQLEGLSWDS
jgi:anti-sigma factor RsiW